MKWSGFVNDEPNPLPPENPDRWIRRNRRILSLVAWVIILSAALFFRTAGLFRGLDANITYHPDAPKQVMSFHNYLNYRYIWYDGSLFIDGYPLFLNHVDEWITRPLFALKEFVTAHLMGAQETKRLTGLPHEDYYPRGWWLFYWLRALRVFYSLLILVGAYALARSLGMSKSLGLSAALLVALSPMEWVLAHNATGDIGVSLFGVAMWLALARYARTEGWAALILAGIFGGFAFASKYQGLLICGVPCLYLLIRHLIIRVDIKQFAVRLTAFILSVLAGIIMATPQFFINARRTRKLIFANFEFIKNYQVPKEILELPFLERAWLGIQKNTWPLLENIGFLLLALALLGLVLAVFRLIASRKTAPLSESSRLAFACSLFALPFNCLVISLIGKYNVQPFHFAYLVVPMILAACYLVSQWWSGRHRGRKLAALAAIPVLLITNAALMAREYRFWVREDTVEVMKHFEHLIFDTFYEKPADIRATRRFNLEPENLPVFRNRIQYARLPHASFWTQLGTAPVPSIPFPARLHWIFDNGPAYPRNDRMFIVPANQLARKTLVWDKKPEQLKIGLRSGLFPAWITIRMTGWSETIRLPPHDQVVIEVPLSAIQPLIPEGTESPPAWHLPISVESRNSTSWATVLTDQRAEAIYRLYGGELDSFPTELSGDIVRADEISGQVNLCSYYGQSKDFGFDITPGRGLPLLDFEPLAAGVYHVKAQVVAPDGGVDLVLRGSDYFSGHDWSNSAWSTRYQLSPGLHTIEWTFQKTLAPHTYQLALGVEKGNAKVIGWTVKPDASRLLDDLRHWNETGNRPLWAKKHRSEAGDKITAQRTTGIQFDDTFELLHLSIPEQPGDLGKLTAYVAIRQIKPMRHVHEQVFFIHFVDQDNQMGGVMGFAVYRALDSEYWNLPITVPIDTKLSGPYRVLVGMTSSRVDRQLPVRTTSPEHEVIGRRVHIDDITFAPAPE